MPHAHSCSIQQSNIAMDNRLLDIFRLLTCVSYGRMFVLPPDIYCNPCASTASTMVDTATYSLPRGRPTKDADKKTGLA